MNNHDLNYAASEWQKYEQAEQATREAARRRRRQQERAAKLEQQRHEQLLDQFSQAKSLRERGRLRAAIKQCDAILRENSEWGDVWFLRGRIHLDSRNHRQAIKDFSATIRCDTAQSSWLARWFGIGFNPACARPYYYRAQAWHQQNKVRRCLADLTSAIRIDSKWAEPRILRAEILLEQKRQLRQVISDLDVAIRTDRKNAKLWFLRGQARLESGDHKRAEADFGHAGKLDASYRMQLVPPPNQGRDLLASVHCAEPETTRPGGHSDDPLPTHEPPTSEADPVTPQVVSSSRTSTYQPYDAWKFPMRITQQQHICFKGENAELNERLTAWAAANGFRRLKSKADCHVYRRGRLLAGPFARSSDLRMTATVTRTNEDNLECVFELRSLSHSLCAKDNTALNESFDGLVAWVTASGCGLDRAGSVCRSAGDMEERV